MSTYTLGERRLFLINGNETKEGLPLTVVAWDEVVFKKKIKHAVAFKKTLKHRVMFTVCTA